MDMKKRHATIQINLEHTKAHTWYDSITGNVKIKEIQRQQILGCQGLEKGRISLGYECSGTDSGNCHTTL